MNLLTIAQALKALATLKTYSDSWQRFKAWQAAKDKDAAEAARKVGLCLLAVFLLAGASCPTKKDVADLLQFCAQFPHEPICSAIPRPTASTNQPICLNESVCDCYVSDVWRACVPSPEPTAAPTAVPSTSASPVPPSPTEAPGGGQAECPANPPPYWKVNGAGGPVPWLAKRFKGFEGFGVDGTIWMGCDKDGNPAGPGRPPITPKDAQGRLYAPDCDNRIDGSPFMAKCCSGVKFNGSPHHMDPRGVCITAHGPSVITVFPQRDVDCNVVAGTEFNGNNWQAFIAIIPGMEDVPVRIEASLPPSPVDPVCRVPFRVIGPITKITTMVPAAAK
jgi:hypothetical protein